LSIMTDYETICRIQDEINIFYMLLFNGFRFPFIQLSSWNYIQNSL
jgi:hypothetical protein